MMMGPTAAAAALRAQQLPRYLSKKKPRNIFFQTTKTFFSVLFHTLS